MEVSILKKPATIKVQSRNLNIAIDPTDEVKADVVLHSQPGEYKVSAEQKVFSGAGEYELRDIMIDGVNVPGGTAYGIEADGVRIIHLASNENQISDAEQEALSPVDVLMIPAHDAKADVVAKLVSMFEPRIIIPVGGSEATIKALADEFGITPEKLPKTKITAKDLPQDSQKLIVLE